MKRSPRRLDQAAPSCFTKPTIILLLCLVAHSPFTTAALGGDTAAAQATAAIGETLRSGERMYREGLLPTGQPVQAFVQWDRAAEDGRVFSCVNCHGRSGMGSVGGGIVTPAITGTRLFQPSYNGPDLTPEERSELPEYSWGQTRRPAYTEQTLVRALREGIDPTGRQLRTAMPRYTMNAGDMAILMAYLRSLSAKPSPGVTEKTLRFATVVTSEVPPRDAAAMLGPLQVFVTEWNRRAQFHATRAANLEQAQDADLAYRRIALDRWQLSGPPATWRQQLEEYYARQPVFALLGGISTGDWLPMHRFSEEHRIPCLFPITDYPAISESDWYSLYFSKGLYGEGEAAAEALGRTPGLSAEDNVVQVYRDSSVGRALAAGFEAGWRAQGRPAPAQRVLGSAEPLPQDLSDPAGTGTPLLLVLWLNGEAVPVLEQMAEGEPRPRNVHLSASLLGKSLYTLSEPVRDGASFSYPYRLPQDDSLHPDYAKPWLSARGLAVDDKRIATRMYTLMLLLDQTIPQMKRNFFRDNLLDKIEVTKLQGYPDFDRLTFAPGLRYVSKECHIVTLSRGSNPILIQKSQ